MPRAKGPDGLAVISLFVSMVSITVGASLAKDLFLTAGPAATAAVRIGIGALALCLIRRPWAHRLTRAELRSIAMYGACMGFMNLLFYSAIARQPIGLAIAIEFLGPLAVAIYFSKKPIDFLWAITAGVGVFLILPVADLTGTISWSGVAFALSAAVAWALYIVLGKRAAETAPPAAVTSYGLVIGFIVIAPFGLTHAAPLLATPALVLTSIGVGLLSSAIPYSLEMFSLRHIPEYYFSLLLSVEPAIGAASAFFVLHEKLSSQQLLAVALIIAASLGSSFTKTKRALNAAPGAILVRQ